jgi:hypothetical protein
MAEKSPGRIAEMLANDGDCVSADQVSLGWMQRFSKPVAIGRSAGDCGPQNGGDHARNSGPEEERQCREHGRAAKRRLLSLTGSGGEAI